MKTIFNPLICLFIAVPFAWCYTLSREYTGQAFIDEFDFWDDATRRAPTGTPQAPSAARYMPRDEARRQGIVWVNPQGHFGLSVDSTFTYSGDGRRPSARIWSQQPIHRGLLILDAVHVPYGQGTWPAFWLRGADGNWPYSGQVDIIEGVNNNTKNAVSYHTGPGICSYDTSVAQTGQLNTAVGTDCDALQHNKEACGNADPDTSSYGGGADDAGGGVWAMEWTSTHIKNWHWSRDNIPDDIDSGNPDPSGWGTPVTHLSASKCDIDRAFGPQSIILDIELCGTWAGNVFPGGPQACFAFVQQHPKEMLSAYFEINYLRYYQ